MHGTNFSVLTSNLRPHPNVVQTLGYCQESDKLVVVVEFCEGGNLPKIFNRKLWYSNVSLLGSLDKKLFDENDFVSPIDQFNLIWNIAKGVYHLHENKIIHRDLAARNILLAHGVPKISVIITVRHQLVTDLTCHYICRILVYHEKLNKFRNILKQRQH